MTKYPITVTLEEDEVNALIDLLCDKTDEVMGMNYLEDDQLKAWAKITGGFIREEFQEDHTEEFFQRCESLGLFK